MTPLVGPLRTTISGLAVAGAMTLVSSCGCSPAQPPSPPTTSSAGGGGELAQRCSVDLRTLKTAVEAYRVDQGVYPTSQRELVGFMIQQRITTADFTSTRHGPPAYSQIAACR